MADMEKLAASLTGNMADVFNVIDRSSYEDDESFLDAATMEAMRRSSPEYQQTRRMIARQYVERGAAREHQQQKARYEAIRRGMSLDNDEKGQIKEQAERMALRDYREGKLTGTFGEAQSKYVARLEKEALDHKSANEMMNQMIRGGRI